MFAHWIWFFSLRRNVLEQIIHGKYICYTIINLSVFILLNSQVIPINQSLLNLPKTDIKIYTQRQTKISSQFNILKDAFRTRLARTTCTIYYIGKKLAAISPKWMSRESLKKQFLNPNGIFSRKRRFFSRLRQYKMF